MLCDFCSNIDLDQLATPEGYKHHSSCADLIQAAQDGCESCQLISQSQWIDVGGDLGKGYDLGSLDTQITARTVHQTPGRYDRMRVGQEIRFEGHQARLNEANISKLSGFISPESPYLWCFLTVAANSSAYYVQFYAFSCAIFRHQVLTISIDDRSSDYIRLRPLEQRLGKNWVRTVAEWLTECISGHEACSHQSSDKIFPPTRVIDVGPSDGSEIPFLCTCRDGIQEWVTLSHCWGQSPPLKTTVSSLPDHQRGLPLDKLPRLFHDAVLITRDLGYRYLWIDSLCIVQDSREDWIRESAYMGNIYKHSVFTISADNCRDSRDNILENHSPIQMNYVKQRCCSSKLLFRSEIYAFSHCEWKQNYKSNHSVLGSRAWALQEQVLSPRTLHWTPLQIAWSCRCTTRSEEDPTGSHPKDLPADNYLYQTKLICLSQEGLQIAKEKDPLHDRYCGPLRLWYLLVMQFCARRITFEEDSLSAVSGLAKEVNRQIGKEYLAGIWAHDIHNGLLWSVGAQASYPSTYVAPSWSWASIKKGRLVHPACMPMTEKSYLGQPVIIKPAAKILETHVTYAWGDNFGPVVSGKLRINAPFKMTNSFAKNEIRLPWVEDTVPLSGEELEPFLYKLQPSTITCWLDARLEGDYAVLYPHLGARGAAFVHIASLASSHVLIPGLNNYSRQRVIAMLQHQNWALILEPVVGDTGEWKRIGVARIADELSDGWESRDFAII